MLNLNNLKYDLRNLDDIIKIYQIAKADTVIYIAAVVGELVPTEKILAELLKNLVLKQKWILKQGLKKQ